MTVAVETATRTPAASPHIPGEVGIWVFVVADMVMFALFFAVFAYYRGEAFELFSAGQVTLNQGYGATNTLLLLTSSWFVVTGIHAAKHGEGKIAANYFALTFLCGAGFVGIKFLEYGEKIRAGLTLTSNDFYMYYYILTGLHFAHVAIGLVVLAFMWSRARRGSPQESDIRFLEGGATYWHMVDVLWIMLFPLVYLLK